MKKLILVFVSLLTLVINAQDINQFDANGERHGRWTKNFDNTDQPRYEGQFEHGEEIGLFKYYKLVGGKSALSATKDFNKETGIAEVQFLSSKGEIISKGKMKGRTYIGTWTYYHNKSDAVLSTERYNENGLLEGEKLVYYENGKLAERVQYKNGAIDGPNIWYSENGNVLKELKYREGELHGEAKYYNQEGILIAEGQYRSDRKHGVWKYYENGNFKEEKDFTVKSKNPKFSNKN